jgi:hypothetical protein
MLLYQWYVSQRIGMESNSLILVFSCGSPLCVLYRPSVIAGAVLTLASHLSSETLEEGWWDLVHLDVSMIHGTLGGMAWKRDVLTLFGLLLELAAEILGYYMDHYVKKSSSSSSSQPPSQTQSPHPNYHSTFHSNSSSNSPLQYF